MLLSRIAAGMWMPFDQEGDRQRLSERASCRWTIRAPFAILFLMAAPEPAIPVYPDHEGSVYPTDRNTCLGVDSVLGRHVLQLGRPTGARVGAPHPRELLVGIVRPDQSFGDGRGIVALDTDGVPAIDRKGDLILGLGHVAAASAALWWEFR